MNLITQRKCEKQWHDLPALQRDRIVAERLFHQNVAEHTILHYTTEIDAAWRVVDHMRRNVPGFCALRMESAGVGYIAAFYSHTQPLDRPYAFVHGDTAPMAICFAALWALGLIDITAETHAIKLWE